MIKATLLGSYCCTGRNSIDFWLGFLGNRELSKADPQVLHVHVNRLVLWLLPCLATSKKSPTNLKQLVYHIKYITNIIIKKTGMFLLKAFS